MLILPISTISCNSIITISLTLFASAKSMPLISIENPISLSLIIISEDLSMTFRPALIGPSAAGVTIRLNFH